uniref:Uncharacterized protein n=1 Tax=Rhizophora mucronata TaxID=61149 RepID=A0A2P2L2D4_RHIMU
MGYHKRRDQETK